MTAQKVLSILKSIQFVVPKIVIYFFRHGLPFKARASIQSFDYEIPIALLLEQSLITKQK